MCSSDCFGLKSRLKKLKAKSKRVSYGVETRRIEYKITENLTNVCREIKHFCYRYFRRIFQIRDALSVYIDVNVSGCNVIYRLLNLGINL